MGEPGPLLASVLAYEVVSRKGEAVGWWFMPRQDQDAWFLWSVDGSLHAAGFADGAAATEEAELLMANAKTLTQPTLPSPLTYDYARSPSERWVGEDHPCQNPKYEEHCRNLDRLLAYGELMEVAGTVLYFEADAEDLKQCVANKVCAWSATPANELGRGIRYKFELAGEARVVQFLLSDDVLQANDDVSRGLFAVLGWANGAQKHPYIERPWGQAIEALVTVAERPVRTDPEADLEEWEIEEELASKKLGQAMEDCFVNAKSASVTVTVDFLISDDGRVWKVATDGEGEVDACLKTAFETLSFRTYKGTIKKVTYPINFVGR